MTAPVRSRAQVLEALQRAQRLQGAHSTVHGATVAARVGINAVDLECLDLVLLHGPLPAGLLAARAGLSATTTTAVLDRLERAGFVRRVRGAADRRLVLVEVESDAVARIAPHYAPLMRHMAVVQKRFTIAELEVVRRYTEAAAAALAAAVEELRDAPVPS